MIQRFAASHWYTNGFQPNQIVQFRMWLKTSVSDYAIIANTVIVFRAIHETKNIHYLLHDLHIVLYAIKHTIV